MLEPFEPFTATKEEMKQEAIERMQILGFSNRIIHIFENENYYFKSENGLLQRPTYEECKIAENHAKEFGYIVFHLLHSYSNIGETLECFTVSPYKEDWDFERALLRENIIMVYAYNYTKPEYSESGSIKIQKSISGYIRIA